VWKWIKKLEKKLPISTEKKKRNLIAIDETVVKATTVCEKFLKNRGKNEEG